MARGILIVLSAAVLAAGCASSESTSYNPEGQAGSTATPEATSTKSAAELKAEKKVEAKRKKAVAEARRKAREEKRRREEAAQQRRAAIHVWKQGFEALYADLTDAASTVRDRITAEYLDSSREYMSDPVEAALDAIWSCTYRLDQLGGPQTSRLKSARNTASRACRRYESAATTIGDGWEGGDVGLIFSGTTALLDAGFLLDDALSGFSDGGGALPPPSPYSPPSSGGDLDCADVGGPFSINPDNDPHGLDGDGDGIACEAGFG